MSASLLLWQTKKQQQKQNYQKENRKILTNHGLNCFPDTFHQILIDMDGQVTQHLPVFR